jgi:hypothetical protein
VAIVDKHSPPAGKHWQQIATTDKHPMKTTFSSPRTTFLFDELLSLNQFSQKNHMSHDSWIQRTKLQSNSDQCFSDPGF